MTAEIRLGTSAFSANGWAGAFYPKGMKSADYWNFYGTRFDTVEVDSTFYRCPTIEAVNNWHFKTPPGFIFSLKVPRTITHDKILLDCDAEFEEFVDTADVLQEKLGPMLLQFPFFGKDVFDNDAQFVARLKAFFMKLPRIGPYRIRAAPEILGEYLRSQASKSEQEENDTNENLTELADQIQFRGRRQSECISGQH